MSATDEYQQVADALEGVGAVMGAAAAQGLLCGMISAPGETDKAAWIAQVLAETQPRGEAAKTCLVALSGLYDRTRSRLDDVSMEFELLLPGDDLPLAERGRELGAWCDSFLLGVGLGGLKQDMPLPQEVGEALRDLGAIAQVEPEAVEAEENEEAFAELVEYVRVAVMLVRTSLLAETRPKQAPAKKDQQPRLH